MAEEDITTLAIEVQTREAEANLKSFNAMMREAGELSQYMKPVKVEVNAEKALSQVQALKKEYVELAEARRNSSGGVGSQSGSLFDLGRVKEQAAQMDAEMQKILSSTLSLQREQAKIGANWSENNEQMRKLRQEGTALNDEMKRLNKNSQAVAHGGFGSLLKMAGGFYVLKQGVGYIRKFVGEFGRMEESERIIGAVLRRNGANVASNLAEYKAYASELRRTIGASDEMTMRMAKMGLTFDIMPGKIKKTIRAAMGLSAAYYGLNMDQAMILLGRAEKGNTDAVGRYGIQLDKNLSAQERFNQLLQIGNDNFYLAEARAGGVSGSLEKVNNSLAAAKGNLGAGLAPAVKTAAEAVGGIAEGFNSLDPSLQGFIAKSAVIVGGVYAWKSANAGLNLVQALHAKLLGETTMKQREENTETTRAISLIRAKSAALASERGAAAGTPAVRGSGVRPGASAVGGIVPAAGEKVRVAEMYRDAEISGAAYLRVNKKLQDAERGLAEAQKNLGNRIAENRLRLNQWKMALDSGAMSTNEFKSRTAHLHDGMGVLYEELNAGKRRVANWSREVARSGERMEKATAAAETHRAGLRAMKNATVENTAVERVQIRVIDAQTGALATKTVAVQADTVRTNGNTAAQGLMTKAMIGAGSAARALAVSLGPIGWGLIAIQAGVSIFTRYSEAAREAAEAARELADEKSRLVAKTQEKGEADRQAFERLIELSKMDELYPAEQEEAKKLVDQLKESYKSLGIVYDKNTGKIQIQAGALKKLEERQESQRKAAIQAAIDAKMQAINALEETRSGGTRAFFSAAVGKSVEEQYSTLIGVESNAKHDAPINEKINKLYRERRELILQLHGQQTKSTEEIKKQNSELTKQSRLERSLAEQAKKAFAGMKVNRDADGNFRITGLMTDEEQRKENARELNRLQKEYNDLLKRKDSDKLNAEGLTVSMRKNQIESEIARKTRDRLTYEQSAQREIMNLREQQAKAQDGYVVGVDKKAIADARVQLLKLLEGAAAATADEQTILSWGKRHGSNEQKNTGWRGIIPDGRGSVMTEVSTGVEIDGKEMEIPLIIPSTTRKEIEYLKKDMNNIPQSMIDKAVEFARKRIAAGKSPFFNGAKEDEGLRNIYPGNAKQIASLEAELVRLKTPQILRKKNDEELYRDLTAQRIALTRKVDRSADGSKEKLKAEGELFQNEQKRFELQERMKRQVEAEIDRRKDLNNQMMRQIQFSSNTLQKSVEASSSEARALETRRFGGEKNDDLFKQIAANTLDSKVAMEKFNQHLKTIANGTGNLKDFFQNL